MGFAEDVERILADTPEYKQVALFSATMPPAIRKITTKYLHDPRRGHRQVENRYRREHLAALHPGGRPAQDGRADPGARGRAVRGDDRLRPHQAGHRGGRRKAAGPRVFRGRHQRRHPAGATRADHRGAQGRQHRHPGRHRRGRPRSRRRAHLARAQLRHPARHRVLRAPHRAHRPGRAQRHRAAVRLPAGAPSAQGDREGDAARRSPRPSCPRSRTSTPNGWPSSPIRSPTRSARPGSSCSAGWSRTTSASTTSRWPTSPRRWRCSPATARRS